MAKGTFVDSITRRLIPPWIPWAAIVGVLLCRTSSACAQTPFQHAGFGRSHSTYSPAPTEHIDPASGTLIIVATDLALPGNAGMDLRVERVYNSGVFPDYANGGSTAVEEDSWAGIGWRLHFGRVLNPNSTAPGATQIEMGDGSRHSLQTTTARPEGWMTADVWELSCQSLTCQASANTVVAER
jgi:uncharacterized protein DUF6531